MQMNKVLKQCGTLVLVGLTGCPVAANIGIGPSVLGSHSYIVRQDSVWVWYHASSTETPPRDTVIPLADRTKADSIVHSFSVTYSSGRNNIFVDGAAWESSLPSDVVQVASLKGPIILVAVSAQVVQATSARYLADSITSSSVYLDAYALSRVLANPQIEMRADLLGDRIFVNGTQYGQTATTIVVEPGEELIRLVDPVTRDTLSGWSVILERGQRLCYYFHRRERRVGRCPAT